MTSADKALLPVALRDTALMVADFADKRGEKDIAALREKGLTQIDALGAELKSRGWPQDMIDDAQYAQCALLDEAALSSLVDEQRIDWESQPLQLLRFETNDAGEALLRRIDRRLQDPQPAARPLLAIFGAVLDLGFTGRLALEGADAKARLREAIRVKLGIVPEASEVDAPVIVKAPVARPWAQRISPLTCIAFACVVLGLVWFGIDGWLNASVARMAR